MSLSPASTGACILLFAGAQMLSALLGPRDFMVGVLRVAGSVALFLAVVSCQVSGRATDLSGSVARPFD